ncbi:MAG TPA: thioredoxin domain-containing protein [Candidatus Acidoferrales bacterium]|nr:thioredoxin domain-containing protein [Candidatus Acidoferrales bacterium]
MKSDRIILLLLLATATLGAQEKSATRSKRETTALPTPASSHPGSIKENLEAYLRRLYAWDSSFLVKIAPLKDAPVPGFYEATVEVTKGEQSDSAVVYVSKDGRYLLRGDMQDMSADPLAIIRSKMRLENSPSRGPANARVVVVEYADFQCPTCRQLHENLQLIVPNYPQVRFIFKDFPLTQIHPWARTAALAGRCAYLQKPDSFWKMYDLIFDSQQIISPENAWQKMLDFATQVGLDPDAFRACEAGSQAAADVEASVKEGQALKIANTPTVFVNGRRLIGADRAPLEQYIQYELNSQPSAVRTQR